MHLSWGTLPAAAGVRQQCWGSGVAKPKGLNNHQNPKKASTLNLDSMLHTAHNYCERQLKRIESNYDLVNSMCRFSEIILTSIEKHQM